MHNLRMFVAIAALVSAGAGRADGGGEATTFDARVLATHNAERSRVGAPPLVWDSDLAKSATAWAVELAKTGAFEHQKQDDQGENLWMGTAEAYQPEEMVDGWVEERKYFKSGRFPEVSTTQDWSDVGHYTQLIWKTTTKVGCAKAVGNGSDFLVCRYSPPGNWMGVEIRTESVTAR
jgi:Cysteine-rich secretory protein family